MSRHDDTRTGSGNSLTLEVATETATPTVPVSAHHREPAESFRQLSQDPVVRRSLFGFAFVGVLVGVLALCGVLPGMTSSLAPVLLYEGALHCMSEQGITSLLQPCHAMGQPYGAPIVQGLLFAVAGALIDMLPGISAYAAQVLLTSAIFAAALAGGFGLLSHLGVCKSVALSGSALYLVSPSLLGMAGFGPTYLAFVLLPAMLWLDVTALRAFRSRPRPQVYVLGGAWFLARLLFIFCDGYAFVVASLATLAVLVGWSSRAPLLARTFAAQGTFVLSTLLAFVCYRTYAPGGGDYAPSSIDVFRSMGADAVSFLSPSGGIWWAHAFDLSTNYALFWGDGSNSQFNYIGYLCIGFAIVGLVHTIRRHRRMAIPLIACGTIAFVMSLGPSLKFNEQRPPLGTEVTYNSYLMPPSAAVTTLPTQQLDEHLPGVSLMRASYRWFLLVRLYIILLAALGVEIMLRRALSRRPSMAPALIVALVSCVAVLELLPNPGSVVHLYRTNDASRRAIDDVATELRRSLPAGSRILFPSPAGDDYLASYLAPMSGLRSYNVGNDKNLELSRAHWPAPVAAAIQGTQPLKAISAVLAQHSVDAVVLARFDLRWSSYSWPPATSYVARGDDLARQLATDPTLTVVLHGWFYLVTSKAG